VITIGIDPHKSSLTAVAIDDRGDICDQLRVRVTRAAREQLLRWAARWPQRRWGVEGAGGLGQPVAQALAAAGEQVLDVASKLAARVRLLDAGHGRKTDRFDARSVALVVLRHRHLRPVRPEGRSVVLRLLTERRDDLVHERTRIVNRLHVLLRELRPGGAKRDLSTEQAAQLLRAVRPATAADQTRRGLARDLIADLRRLDRAIRANEAALRAEVLASGTTLTQVLGVGDVLAAKVLGHVGEVSRFPSPGSLRQLCRRGSARGFQWRAATAPAQPSRQPPAQHRTAHGRALPGAPAGARTGLLPAEDRRRQEPQRGQPRAQATPGQRRLSPADHRP
jgi:transposase